MKPTPEDQGSAPNFAARAGRWSSAHWKIATIGWLGFVAVAFLLGNAVGRHALAQPEAGNGESGRASKTLARAGFKRPASETVLVQSREHAAADRVFRSVVDEVSSAI